MKRILLIVGLLIGSSVAAMAMGSANEPVEATNQQTEMEEKTASVPVVDETVNFTGEVIDTVGDTGANIVDASAKGIEGAGEGFQDFTDATGEVLSGDLSKTPNMITDPAVTTVENTGEFVGDVATSGLREHPAEETATN